MERVKRGKEKVLGSSRNTGNRGYRRICIWLVVLASCCLASCTTIKKAGVTSLATGAAVTVATALSTGATVPILAATTGAFATSVVTDLTMSSPKGQDMTSCAPDNFWTLIGSLVEMGGWLLILIFVAPMILGWVLPGPLERKKKQKVSSS